MTACGSDIRSRLRLEWSTLQNAGGRSVPATETIARWSRRELWERWGITRLGRLTGLDRIGVPVWMSVRPNARTLAVCQGKGLDDAAAAASALMEAVEIATAENLNVACRHASRRVLIDEGSRFDDLPGSLRSGAKVPLDHEEHAWLQARDLLSEEPIYLPADAIRLDDTRNSLWWRSTDGLASGNILAEAVLHALCERIERDAMALWAYASANFVRAACISPANIPGEGAADLIERVEAAGFLVRVFDITTDIGIPCMFAVLFPREIPRPALGYLDVTSGSGCHPVASKAVERAVTEAVQSRLTKIAAARDDFDPDLYDARLPQGILLYADCEPNPSRPIPCRPAPEPTCQIDEVLGALEAAAVRDVWLAILADEPGLAVVKAIVPGLERLPSTKGATAGPRLVRHIMSAA